MFQSLIVFCILLISNQAHALIYRDKDSFLEGLRLGNESYTRAVGIVRTSNDVKTNGILIHPQWVLTAAHGVSAEGIFVVAPDVYTFIDGNGIPIRFREKFRHENIVFHPSTDLALIKLDKPFDITPIPILSKSPSRWESGYLVSFGPSMAINMIEEERRQYLRHVAINYVNFNSQFDVEKLPPLLDSHQNDDILAWTRFGFLETIFKYVDGKRLDSERSHLLTASTTGGDSGAPFIIEVDGQFRLAGIHVGKIRVDEAGDKESIPSAIVQGQETNVILPLFLYEEWIVKTMAQLTL